MTYDDAASSKFVIFWLFIVKNGWEAETNCQDLKYPLKYPLITSKKKKKKISIKNYNSQSPAPFTFLIVKPQMSSVNFLFR